jgi:uncharacterized protein (DUF697 family)|tara:strand:- start:196 stop:762 length:567 start_codon:yes stop_codon:yes gene_type:complete
MSKEKQKSILKKLRENLENNISKIEERTDISDDEKVLRIIKVFAAGCAAFAVQPIPFADFFVLTPIQAYMGTRIGAIRGVPVSESKATEIFKEIAGVIGLGLLAQQLVIGLYKTFIPFLGAITTIPIVYGLTYGIGRVMDLYFIQKRRHGQINKDELIKMWKKSKKEGAEFGNKEKDKIWETKDDFKA